MLAIRDGRHVKQTGQNIEKLFNRHLAMRRKSVEEKVRTIIDDVRHNGDDALIKYEKNENVACISGYMYPVNKKLPETFF